MFLISSLLFKTFATKFNGDNCLLPLLHKYLRVPTIADLRLLIGLCKARSTLSCACVVSSDLGLLTVSIG